MIADVYDAMTSARVYRGPVCPFEVISTFETEGLTKYDPKYIMTFLDHLTQLYLHSTVRLNDGAVGQIILMNRNSLSKPVIRIGKDFVDLSNQNDLYISAII
jgi:HD-GYP domain-containing protein (c-di-GMP phosphodiesterase class II)